MTIWLSYYCYEYSEWVKSLSHVRLFATPWTVVYQVPPSTGFSQAVVLEWVAISFSRVSSWPRDWTQISLTVDRCFTVWATREVLAMRISPDFFWKTHASKSCQWNTYPLKKYIISLVLPGLNYGKIFDFYCGMHHL